MYLTEILEYKKNEIREFKKKHSFSEFEKLIPSGKSSSVFSEALKKTDKFAIIAEVKKSSPSKGLICGNFDPKTIALTYEKIGIDAISVLTDEKFFGGLMDHLKIVRKNTSVPVLRKDFILDEIQILEACASGADAVLLIAAALPAKKLAGLIAFSYDIGCAPLVEIHDDEELKKTFDSGAEIIGINNRNLNTFKIDLETSVRLLPMIPDRFVRISESGIENNSHIRKIRTAGADAFLIGTAFMQALDKEKFLTELLDEG